MKIPEAARKHVERADKLMAEGAETGFDLGSVEATCYSQAAALYASAIIIILNEA